MNRLQLEHVLRASASLSGCREMVVIGSQALLASHPDAPQALLRSMEVDLYPLEAPEKADLIDGSIGEVSPFHDAFGYYAHGVGVETAILPAGWRGRWIRVETEGAVGWCLSPVDLAISKLAAGRSKDIEFVRGMLEAGLMLGVTETTLNRHGAVSEATARAMAQGAITHSRSDWAIAITGIAGPSGGSPEKPVGTVCFAWANRDGACEAQTCSFAGDRAAVREQSVHHALRGLLVRIDALPMLA